MNERDLLDLKANYCSGLASHIVAIERLCVRLGQGEDTRPELRGLAHKLRGSGGTYGFPDISAAASLVELVGDDEVWARAITLRDVLRAVVGCQPTSPARVDAPSPAALARILLVDDDEDVCRVVTARMRSEGYEVAHFLAGEPALEAFGGGGQFDLAILDVRLPDLSGLEVLARIRRTADLPVLMLTALDREARVVEAFELGADEYITKPFRPRELVARVARLLRSAPTSTPRGGWRGTFRGDELLDLVQMLATTRRSGTLRVSSSARAGSLELAVGQLVAIQPEAPTLEDGAESLLGLEEGCFEFTPSPASASTEGISLERLLLNVARTRDENAALGSAA